MQFTLLLLQLLSRCLSKRTIFVLSSDVQKTFLYHGQDFLYSIRRFNVLVLMPLTDNKFRLKRLTIDEV